MGSMEAENVQKPQLTTGLYRTYCSLLMMQGYNRIHAMNKYEELRKIPRTDDLLREAEKSALLQHLPRPLVVEALREETDSARREILQGERMAAPLPSELIRKAEDILQGSPAMSLRRVVNATGVILHTNLGRAVLSESAVRRLTELAGGYSNLEYDLAKGTRGSRHDHAAALLCRLTGAEDAMLVNNNAAAVLLTLAALSCGREVILSRGELIEIGGAFRIPDIMECSGAVLREVGTTNRTRISDYESALGENTGMLMKVHPSNYRITGFTEEASLEQLSALAHANGLPFVYDMGSGLLTGLGKYGIDEPDIRHALQQGADLVMCSGDKLLGGAQAGILTGKKELIDQLKCHPLARVFRVDKLTLAATEATLYDSLDTDRAVNKIPVLRMIAADSRTLRTHAEELCARLRECVPCGKETAPPAFAVEPVQDRIGGGAAPDTVLQGWAVTARCGDPTEAERQLRQHEIPVIARVAENRVWMSVRTLQNGDDEVIADAFTLGR